MRGDDLGEELSRILTRKNLPDDLPLIIVQCTDGDWVRPAMHKKEV